MALNMKPNIRLSMRKTGVNKEFSIDDELPDESDGWAFVERKEKNPIPTTDDAVAGGKGLPIWNGDDNITSEAVVRSGAQFVLVHSLTFPMSQ